MALPDDIEHGQLDGHPDDSAEEWGNQRDDQWWEEQTQAEEFALMRSSPFWIRAIALLIAAALLAGSVGTFAVLLIGSSR